MKFYIAKCVAHPVPEQIHAQRAAGGVNTLKQKLSSHPNSRWSVMLFNSNLDKEALYDLIEDPQKLEFEDGPMSWEVDPKGRVREEE